jgi:hypothetical protein
MHHKDIYFILGHSPLSKENDWHSEDRVSDEGGSKVWWGFSGILDV